MLCFTFPLLSVKQYSLFKIDWRNPGNFAVRLLWPSGGKTGEDCLHNNIIERRGGEETKGSQSVKLLTPPIAYEASRGPLSPAVGEWSGVEWSVLPGRNRRDHHHHWEDFSEEMGFSRPVTNIQQLQTLAWSLSVRLRSEGFYPTEGWGLTP